MTETVETKVPFCIKTIEGTVLTFTFGDGEVITTDVSTYPDETQEDLKMHGASQKGGDSYASAGGDYAFAKTKLRETISNLEQGLWATARAKGEGKKPIGELAQALAELQGVDVSSVTEVLGKASAEELKIFRSHPQVKAKILQLRADKATAALAKATADGKAVALPSFAAAA
jgi:hypothetical protein